MEDLGLGETVWVENFVLATRCLKSGSASCPATSGEGNVESPGSTATGWTKHEDVWETLPEVLGTRYVPWRHPVVPA